MYLKNFDRDKFLSTSKKCVIHIEREVRQDMDEKEISGKLIRPDGADQYWWNGVNYINVIPEELIDAVVASEKNKEIGGKENEDKVLPVWNPV